MSFTFDGFAAIPGIGDVRYSIADGLSYLCWGPVEHNRAYIWPTVIDSATVDSGHDDQTVPAAGPTTILRPGLLMAFTTATKQAGAYNAGGAGGLATLAGPLIYAVNMLQAGAAVDRAYGFILVGGLIKTSKTIYNPANAGPGGWFGHGDAATVRTALDTRFIRDDRFYDYS